MPNSVYKKTFNTSRSEEKKKRDNYTCKCICSIMGFHDEVVDAMTDQDCLSYPGIEYWIDHYFDDKEDTLQQDWSLKQQFHHFGFNDATSEFLVRHLKSNPVRCKLQNPARYWADLYIGDLFENHTLLYETLYDFEDCKKNGV